ncbi:hypothetical protein FACS1894188_09840 [Clostridia bacterium]|nr:hypothetical protein FACS1894188_09840 [Clostridia bacterium]
MLRSSLGFHTLTLSLILTEKEAKQLMGDFKMYSRNTGFIKIFPVDGNRVDLLLTYCPLWGGGRLSSVTDGRRPQHVGSRTR